MAAPVIDETTTPRTAHLYAVAGDDTCTWSFGGRKVKLYRALIVGAQEDAAVEAIYSLGISTPLIVNQIWSASLPPVTLTTVLYAIAELNLACLEIGGQGSMELTHDGVSTGELNALVYFDFLT